MYDQLVRPRAALLPHQMTEMSQLQAFNLRFICIHLSGGYLPLYPSLTL